MRTLIAIPCMDMVHTIFFRSMLSLQKAGECQFGLSCSSLVYDARNTLAKQAVREGFDRILWLDSDMDIPVDAMLRLSARMDEGYDFVSGIYFKRKAPVTPVIYEHVGYWHNDETNELTPAAQSYLNYEKDGFFEIEGAGFGLVMHSVKLIKDVAEKYGLPFSPIIGFGEDLSFCLRARELGYKLYCDASVKAGHVGMGVITEDMFLGGRTNGTN